MRIPIKLAFAKYPEQRKYGHKTEPLRPRNRCHVCDYTLETSPHPAAKERKTKQPGKASNLVSNRGETDKSAQLEQQPECVEPKV